MYDMKNKHINNHANAIMLTESLNEWKQASTIRMSASPGQVQDGLGLVKFLKC